MDLTTSLEHCYAETQTNSCDHVNNYVDILANGNSAISEVSEEKQVEEADIVERESTR